MRYKIIYWVLFFVRISCNLLATHSELALVAVNPGINHSIEVKSVADSADKLVEDFYKKKIVTKIEYRLDGREYHLSRSRFPEKRRVKKFLKKAQNLSQVNFSTFLDDYEKQLEECIDIIKKDGSMWYLFVRKKVQLDCLYSLISVGDQLESIYATLHDKNWKGENGDKGVHEGFEYKLENATIAKKDMLGSFFCLSHMSPFCFTINKGAITMIYNFSVLLTAMRRHLTKDFFKISDFGFTERATLLGACIFNVLLTFTLVMIAKKRGDSLWLKLHVLNSIDSLVLFPLGMILCYEIRGFLCNPVGLIVPFWNYYAMHEGFHDIRKKELANHLEKTIGTIRVLRSEEKMGALYLLLHEGEGYPKLVAKVIVSFLDVRLAMESIYAGEMKKMKSDYYYKAAMLSTSLYDNTLENYRWFLPKMLGIFVFGLSMILGMIYFVCSLLSIKRALTRG